MKNIYDEIGLPSERHHKKIEKLVEPLNVFFRINRFWRCFHRKDGFCSLLGNSPSLIEEFFGKELYVGHPYFRNPHFYESGYILSDDSLEYENTQGQLRGDGKCNHLLIYIEKNEHGFIEYGFATSLLHPGFESVYLNHLQEIGRFINAFEQNAARLIQEANERPVNVATSIGTKYEEKPQFPNVILSTNQTLHFLSEIHGGSSIKEQLLSLTKRERLSLRQYLSGNTMQEIAKKFCRSPRTIEKHLENAKAKLNVQSPSQLFELLAQFQDVL